MQKYKLINNKTKEETICTLVTIDGFDYYVSAETPNKDSYFIHKTVSDVSINLCIQAEWLNIIGSNMISYYSKYCSKVIATNNPNVDIPKVINEVDEIDIAEAILQSHPDFKAEGMSEYQNGRFNGIIEGLSHYKETHPFTQQDLIEFADYVRENDLKCNAKMELDIKHSKDLFDIWVTEKLETINFKK